MPWYHVSYGWHDSRMRIDPRCGRVDDETDPREQRPFIAVCPTIGQCLVALGELGDVGVAGVYQSIGEPEPADWVFDFAVTAEHRFYAPTSFTRICTIDCERLADAHDLRNTTDLGVLRRNLLLLQQKYGY